MKNCEPDLSLVKNEITLNGKKEREEEKNEAPLKKSSNSLISRFQFHIDFNRFQSPPFVAVAVIVTVRRAFFSLLLLQSGLVSNEIFMLKASVKKRRDDDDNSQKYLGDEYVIDL